MLRKINREEKSVLFCTGFFIKDALTYCYCKIIIISKLLQKYFIYKLQYNMHLSTLKIRNFRKFGSESEIFIDKNLRNPDLEVSFMKWLNILIWENDSGKTAIIDAIKLVLKTHSIERIKLEDEDFYKETNKLRIECRFDDLCPEEAKNFTEWLGIEWEWVDAKIYLKIILEAQKKNGKILPFDINAWADNIWYPLNAEAKEYLKTTYLKPLRDASGELAPKRWSRLSQILQGHEIFKDKNENHELVELFWEFKDKIDGFFSTGRSWENIKKYLDSLLKDFFWKEQISKFEITDQKLKNILETLKLILDDWKLWLWSHNLLFIASELLNLERTNRNGARIGLIEELEAHLHPQAQMRVIESLQDKKDVQFILTTHSPNIASKVKLENLIICTNDTTWKSNIFPMGNLYTKLDESGYVFLEKFLDVTKSNLFFANGIIFVEGWAEEILLPILAKKIWVDLTKKGVSIVNVWSTAFLKYSKIFQRNNIPHINIPVSIVTDNDIYPDMEQNKKIKQESKNTTLRWNEDQLVKVFMGEDWTLEWALFKSPSISIHFKNVVKNIHSGTLEFQNNQTFEQKLIEKLKDKSLKKTEIAYQLAQMLQDDLKKDVSEILIDENDQNIKYLINAIKYAANEN